MIYKLWLNNISSIPTLVAIEARQNGPHFADDILICIFYGNGYISIKISQKYVPDGPINNIPALVQITAWCRLGDEPLSETMMVRLPTSFASMS